MAEVIHAVPIGDESLTRCCRRSPFDLPLDDRLDSRPEYVTCTDTQPRKHWVGPVMERRYWLTEKGWAAAGGHARPA